jgi:sulfate adenylyltransferase
MSVRDDAITAHGGGELSDLKAPAAERASLKSHAASLQSVRLNARDLSDLEMLASGAFSPLAGFMGEADYLRARDEMRLVSGAPWSIPITLGVEEAIARTLKPGTDIALETESGERIAILKLAEIYKADRVREAEQVFGTAEDAHPGAKNVTSMPPWCLGGRVILFAEIPGRTFLEYRLEPRDTRAAFRERGWRKIVAFQTRNPTHRAHEYIQKAALEICDGLLLHPLVGET